MRTLLHLYLEGEWLVLCAKVLQSPWHRLDTSCRRIVIFEEVVLHPMSGRLTDDCKI